MTDDMQSIRNDLAFLKTVAADEGNLPWVAGASFLAAGLIYGLPIIAVWAQMRGLIDVPGPWPGQVSLWSTAVFVPLSILIPLKGPKPRPGASIGRSMAVSYTHLTLPTIYSV